jgi:hypothetical protein
MTSFKTKEILVVSQRLADIVYNVVLHQGTIIQLWGGFYRSVDGVVFSKKSVENNPEIFEPCD